MRLHVVDQYGISIQHMMQAWELASDAGVDKWQFAVDIESLVSTGISKTALRWLVCQGLFEHALETTRRTARRRTFQVSECLQFRNDSCFVITSQGRMALLDSNGNSTVSGRNGDSPRWDVEMRCLTFRGVEIKRFRRPAENQEAVLSTFEEESWCKRVDDPLPQTSGKDPKKRLHDTINALNRNQQQKLIRFFGDGTGEGICWEPLT